MEQRDYTVLFVERQEQILIDYLRKTIDLEIKNKLLSDQVEPTKQQSQQNEILKNEALSSLERISYDMKVLQERFDKSQAALNNKDIEFNNLVREKQSVQLELGGALGRIKELEREMERQNQEMQIIVSEKDINTKKAVKRTNVTKTVEEDSF